MGRVLALSLFPFLLITSVTWGHPPKKVITPFLPLNPGAILRPLSYEKNFGLIEIQVDSATNEGTAWVKPKELVKALELKNQTRLEIALLRFHTSAIGRPLPALKKKLSTYFISNTKTSKVIRPRDNKN